MKLMKSLFLGTAAGFAAVAGAQAADLPSKKAAPVEYVRICSQFGAGFFYIPGSDTCLKVSGRVRADYIYGEPYQRNTNALTFRARGYLALDSYTATDWGPVRATTRVFVTKDSATPFGQAPTGVTTTLDWAYIQFAGITAGRVAVSFFEFAPFGGVSYLGGGANGRGSDLGSINALAYTATFGGGFSATLALEDATERRIGVNAVGANLLLGSAVGQPTYGGQLMPDVVARLDYTGSWGTAALTGAVHQTRVGNGTVPGNVIGAGNVINDTEYGFAVQAGVKINLPMLAPGDALFLQAAYADGANSYTGWGSAGTGTASIPTTDVIYDNLGNGHTTKSWSVTGGLLHYWVPTFRQGVYAAYGAIDHYGPWYDAAAFSVGTNLIWSPVKGLDIGAEVGWQKLVDRPNFVNLVGQVNPFLGQKDNQWFGRLRFQRDF